MKAMSTWNKNKDGLPIIDYTSPYIRNNVESIKGRNGKHAERIVTELFKKFLKKPEGLDFDIMLEIKDKEKSALKALRILNS